MTRTARRRWSREFSGEIDGIVLGETGPVYVHGYDPPAGGKWVDNVIPGKLGAFDRSSGDSLWISPCEVGYGRGFGSGFGPEGEVVLLGPSLKGHRIARMQPSTGELLGLREIEPFDQALVAGDMCVTLTPGRVAGILTSAMIEVWAHSKDGERFHMAARDGARVLVTATDVNRKRQGVIALDVATGELEGCFVSPEYPVIHEIVAESGVAVLLVGNKIPGRGSRAPEELRIEGFSTRSSGEGLPLWREVVANSSPDDLPDISIAIDSGKLYVARGAMLEVRDALTGRALGELTLPGLDERVAWQVSQGAGLLAEESRASVFELPA